MRITFDPTKRDKALSERGLDFDDAALIFAGITLDVEDTRKDYGETRVICYGLLYIAPEIVASGFQAGAVERRNRSVHTST